jgi:hypothetical protein
MKPTRSAAASSARDRPRRGAGDGPLTVRASGADLARAG